MCNFNLGVFMKIRRGREKELVCNNCGIRSVNSIGWYLYFIDFISLKKTYRPTCPKCLKKTMIFVFGKEHVDSSHSKDFWFNS